jgi:hypothetical protein
MKRLVAIVAAIAALALSASAVAPASTTSFNGLWSAIDVGDGSHMLLLVAGGSTKFVAFYDASAHACLGYSNPAFVATGSAVLGSDGTTMVATMTARCVANPGVILFGSPITFNFTANGDGTISDDTSGAAFWTRDVP